MLRAPLPRLRDASQKTSRRQWFPLSEQRLESEWSIARRNFSPSLEDGILVDQREHKVLNGAMAVRRVKIDDPGREVQHQRFVRVLVDKLARALPST